MRASKYGHEEVCNLLLEKGADAKAKDSRNRTALALASMKGHYQCCKLLMSNGADSAVQDGVSGSGRDDLYPM